LQKAKNPGQQHGKQIAIFLPQLFLPPTFVREMLLALTGDVGFLTIPPQKGSAR
jgi:hypothetical protein